MEGRVSKERRQFSRSFKLMALERMEGAPNVEALADELGVRREMLYVWRRKFLAGGEAALRSSGRPRPLPQAPERLAADEKVAALERKLGQRDLEVDFLKRALRRIEASRGPNTGPGVTASSRRSGR
jgi:transposase